MHVLVATDGSLDVERAAAFASSLAGPDGSTTVATIVRVPRSLVSDLRSVKFGASPAPAVDADLEYVEKPPGVGEPPRRSWPGDDALIDHYLGDKRIELCEPIVEAIAAAGGEAKSIVREGDDPATNIIDVVNEIGAEAVVVGSHGHGGFQGLLGSTGAKLVRRSPCPVLVVR